MESPGAGLPNGRESFSHPALEKGAGAMDFIRFFEMG